MNCINYYVVVMGVNYVDVFVVVFCFDKVFYDFFVFIVGEVIWLWVDDFDIWCIFNGFGKVFFMVNGDVGFNGVL